MSSYSLPDPAKRRNSSTSPAPAANAPLNGLKETKAMLDGIPQQGNALGKKNAPVTMPEYSDDQCPFCRDYALNTMPILINDYVRTGKLRMVFNTLTFIGPDSESAARAGATRSCSRSRRSASGVLRVRC